MKRCQRFGTGSNPVGRSVIIDSLEPTSLERKKEVTWKKLKKQVYKRYGRKCYICRARPGDTMDHRIPLSLGGKTSVENLRPCCLECNKWKKDIHPALVKKAIQERGIVPGEGDLLIGGW